MISLSPAAGTQVSAGSAVNLVVSTGLLAVDKMVFSDGVATRTISGFSTAAAGETLIAFTAADGPATGSQTDRFWCSLTWTLVRRVNTQHGSSEIWKATAPSVLTMPALRAHRPAPATINR